MEESIIVIGAGIVGVSIALALQTNGYQVHILDRKGVAAEVSSGNAGGFAFSTVIPLATPGIIRKVPKWLFDPLGPLSIPLGYVPKITPWMLRFWRASRQDRYTQAIKAQIQLMQLSKSATERQIKLVNGESLIRRNGQLQLFSKESAFQASLEGWEICRRHNLDFELLKHPDAIAEIQPGLDKRFSHAVFTPTWINTVDPKTWTKHLLEVFLENKGKISQTNNVQSIVQQGNKVTLITAKGKLQAARAVVAAGAWSHLLARSLGDKIPLETERGYNTTLPAGAFDLRTHLTFVEHGFAASRINDGVRIGGAVELGGLKIPPNYRRAEILLHKASQFMLGLKTQGGTQWMGFRPSLPDSLPVIGRSPKAQSVFYAFGHGHLGLTQSAATAELITALVAGVKLAVPIEPYSAKRF